MHCDIRPLTERDWQKFAELRLLALKSDPAVFGSSFEREVGFQESHWRDLLTSPDACVQGVFVDGECIGIGIVSIDELDPTRTRGKNWGAWIRPDFRGNGLYRLLNRTRLDWAKNHESCKVVVYSHRESNLAARAATQELGATCSEVKSRVWADGLIDNELTYSLVVKE